MVPLGIDGANIIEGAREVLSPRARREQQQQQATAAAAASGDGASQAANAANAPPQIPFVGGAVVSPPASSGKSSNNNGNSNKNRNPIAAARDNLEAAAERLGDKAKETAASAADAAAQLGEDIRSRLPEGLNSAARGDSSPSSGKDGKAAAEPRGFIWLPGPEDAADTSDPTHPGWIRAPKPDARPAIGVWAGLGIAAGALLLAVVGVGVAFGMAVKLRRARAGGAGGGGGTSPTGAASSSSGLFAGTLLRRSSTQCTTSETTPAETPRSAGDAPA